MNSSDDSVPARIAVLISGGGRTLLNLDDRTRAGTLNAKIVRVVSSRPDAPGVSLARARGLNVVVVDRGCMDDRAFDDALTAAVMEARPDLVCMAGFLSLWRIPLHLLGRVLNIHPALLPDFGGRGMFGRRVHEAVLAEKRTESGCTVHFCDNEYDHGPIILQRRVAVEAGDTPETLAARVFEQECIAYPQAIQMVLSQRGRQR